MHRKRDGAIPLRWGWRRSACGRARGGALGLITFGAPILLMRYSAATDSRCRLTSRRAECPNPQATSGADHVAHETISVSSRLCHFVNGNGRVPYYLPLLRQLHMSFLLLGARVRIVLAAATLLNAGVCFTPTTVRAQSIPADSAQAPKGGFMQRMAKKAAERLSGGGNGFAALIAANNAQKAASERVQREPTPFAGTYRVTVSVMRTGAAVRDSEVVYLRTFDRPTVATGFNGVVNGEPRGFIETGYYIGGVVAPTLDSLPVRLEDAAERRDLRGAVGLLLATRDTADAGGVGTWRLAALVSPRRIEGPVWRTTSNGAQQSIDIQDRQLAAQSDRAAWLDASGAAITVTRSGLSTPAPIDLAFSYWTDKKRELRVTVRMERVSAVKYERPLPPAAGKK